MKCSEVMKRDLSCCNPTDSVADIASKMRDKDIGFVPVCDANGKVLGTITDRDLTVRVLASKRSPESTHAQDVMSKDVISCKPDDDLDLAERLMAKHQKSRMLCIDTNGKLAGVISLADLARKDNRAEPLKVVRSVKAPNGSDSAHHVA